MYSYDWASGFVSPFCDRNGDSVYTTPQDAIEKLIDCILASPHWRQGSSSRLLVDMGSGDGRIVLAAARRGVSAMGVELDPLLVEASRAAAAAESLHAASFVCASLLEVELPAQADVVAYLLPEGLAKLAHRLAAIDFGGHLFALRWSLDGQPGVELVRRLPLNTAKQATAVQGDDVTSGAASWMVHEYKCIDAAATLAREAAIAQQAWRAAQAARLSASSSPEVPAPTTARAADAADAAAAEAAAEAAAAEGAFLEVMLRVRKEVVGSAPAWRCDQATHALLAEVTRLGLAARLGRGRCEAVRGSFLGAHDGAAMPHCFLRFADGTIADLTADQFEEALPQVWWPADATRYSLTRAASSLPSLLNAQRLEEARQRREAANATQWWAGC